MDIKASDVKALREKTGAGMMECKKALVEAGGDAAGAEKILKEKGLAAVAKRSDRVTAEGRIFARRQNNKIAVIEVNCETDFVANNKDFMALGEKLLDITFENNFSKIEEAHKVLLTELATKIRENMSIRSIIVIDIPSDSSAGLYIHSDHKSGAVVIVKGSSGERAGQFAYDCCLHVTAFTPAYIKRSDVPQSYIDEQTEIFKAQIDQDEKIANKPDKVKDGILKGKINKHLSEICFESQMFVKDDKKTVTEKLSEVSKETGAALSFGQIELFVLGK